MSGRPQRPRWSTVLVLVTLDLLALGLTIAIVPGVTASSGWTVLAAAAVLGVAGRRWSGRSPPPRSRGWAGWRRWPGGWSPRRSWSICTVSLTPGLESTGIGQSFLAACLYAALVSIGLWFVTAGDHTMVVRHLLRVNRRHRAAATPSDIPGRGHDPDRRAVGAAGATGRCARATCRRWAAGCAPAATPWPSGTRSCPRPRRRARPACCTAPATRCRRSAGTRRRRGRLVVTNHPRDARLVEARMTDGRGLLADGGVSVSNVFSGDAPTSLLTMSSVRSPGRPGASYVSDLPARPVRPHPLAGAHRRRDGQGDLSRPGGSGCGTSSRGCRGAPRTCCCAA